jgi:hypothetical protein
VRRALTALAVVVALSAMCGASARAADGESALDPGIELVTRATPGAKGRVTVSLTLLPRAGHRLHPDAPIVLRPRARGARVERAIYTRADAADPRAEAPRFELVLTVEDPATAAVDVACAFTLCRGDRCRPVETTARAADLTGTRTTSR